VQKYFWSVPGMATPTVHSRAISGRSHSDDCMQPFVCACPGGGRGIANLAHCSHATWSREAASLQPGVLPRMRFSLCCSIALSSRPSHRSCGRMVQATTAQLEQCGGTRIKSTDLTAHANCEQSDLVRETAVSYQVSLEMLQCMEP
jgi:hypothetical protein